MRIWINTERNETRDEIFFYSILLFFTTLPLECSCVCVSPTHQDIKHQPQGRSLFNLRLHSVSQQVGSKQTHERTQMRPLKHDGPQKKTKKTYTLPVFVWGVEKHSQRGLLDYYCCKNKEQNTENNMCKIRLMTFLSLKKAFCWCYDFVLPMCWSMICWLYSKTEFLSVVICNNQLVVEQLQGRVVQWDSYFSPLRDGL